MELKEELTAEETESSKISAYLEKLNLEEITLIGKTHRLDDTLCSCESCEEKSSSPSGHRDKVGMIQSFWLELRQYIRIVYRLSMKGSLKSIDDEYRMYMKDIVGRLCAVCNPHQLYQRLEAQVEEFLFEVKVRLLQLMDRLAENSKLPRIFISAMLDWYNKMVNAANELTPVLQQFETEHLSKFNLSWKVLNQRLFQTNIYTNIFFQNRVPLFITQLGKSCDSEQNKALVREFLSFDDEITVVEDLWKNVAEKMKQYTQSMKKSYKTPEKLCYRKLLEQYWAKDDNELFLPDDNSDDIPCECHFCVNSRLNNYLDKIAESAENTLNVERLSKLIHRNIASESGKKKCLADCTAGNNKKQPGFGCVGPKSSPTIATKVNQSLSLGKGQPFKRRIPADKAKAADHTNEKLREQPNFPSSGSLNKPTDQACKNSKERQNNEPLHNHCSKHTETIRRVSCSDQLGNGSSHCSDEAHSDLSPLDSRHCDCCYCEVFGHGIPVSAPPVGRNYQEIRERLRLLLNKKKSKCKGSSSVAPPTAVPSPQQPFQSKKEPQQQVNQAPKAQKDTRDLEDLIDFIEGTEVKCRNEKKAAKKARQKEKKRIVLERIKMEEEQRQRLLEELQRRQKQRDEEILEAARRLEKKKKKNKNKGGLDNLEKNAIKNTISSSNNPGSQMVTIKRIMEPHNSEPTVTITLRGATPNQDRVLYTLLNGQVCKVKPHEAVNQVKAMKEPAKCNSYRVVPSPIVTPPMAQIQTNGKKMKSKKEPPKSDISKPQPQRAKPSKGLTNPTSIQINNAINSMSKNMHGHFNIDDLKLPPGITITKVDPSNLNLRPSHKEGKPSSGLPVKNNTASEVIVVATNKLKGLANNDSLRQQPVLNASNKKKKNKKKENGSSVINKNKSNNPTTYPGLDIEPIPPGFDPTKTITKPLSVLTINPYADSKVMNGTKTQDPCKKKKKKSKKQTKVNPNNQDEWKLLDSVFAPKDIDLNDGELDDAERELEAFKLFCLQSVPLKRKEKVNLNLKDIVLKKKSPIPCN